MGGLSMKWVLKIIVLFGLIVGAAKLYEIERETAMAALIFFIILPYFGGLIASFLQDDKIP